MMMYGLHRYAVKTIWNCPLGVPSYPQTNFHCMFSALCCTSATCSDVGGAGKFHTWMNIGLLIQVPVFFLFPKWKSPLTSSTFAVISIYLTKHLEQTKKIKKTSCATLSSGTSFPLKILSNIVSFNFNKTSCATSYALTKHLDNTLAI